MNSKHALFAATEAGTFRIGLPTTLNNAMDRWQRADDRLNGFNGHARRACNVLGFASSYPVRFFEVRAIDPRTGKGLGSLRHDVAVPVPFRALRTALRPR